MEKAAYGMVISDCCSAGCPSAPPSTAVLRVDAKETLPFQLAAERRARAASIRPQAAFDLASLPQASRPYRAWATPSVDVVATAGVVSDKRGGSYVQDRKSTRLNSSH